MRELQQARLVSIVGAGGIGKTTVALAVAEQWIGTCPDGVWMVDLSPLKDPSLVPNAIATAIGMTAHSSNMLEALSAFFRSREMLLVFDSSGISSMASHRAPTASWPRLQPSGSSRPAANLSV
ncbi:hypothetical protein RLEG12_13505 [Rhizobium leguminosarum bv. trifolii CB782]|nr:hypothetical protein RLEG12_13505 [Rhizobium leguminosarum bv. trifolii CB782]